MMVFFKPRLVVLSVPRTGTTALQAALGARADMLIANPPALKHAPVYRYNRFLRPMFKQVCGVDLALVGVMREPVSWLGSWYRYRRRAALAGHPNATADMSFDAFVAAYCSDAPPAFANVGCQAKFLERQPNGVGPARIFDYHQPETLLAFLAEELGELPQVPRLNVAPAAPLALSAQTEARLRERYAAAFDLYEAVRANRT